MVMLPESQLSVVGQGDGGILIGLLPAQVERHHHQAPTSWRGDAAELAHRSHVVGDVLEHMRAEHGVEARIGEVKRSDVQAEVNVGLVEVSCDVAQRADSLQPVAQRPFGGEMQQRMCALEQFRAACEEHPLSAMTFVGTTSPAQSVGAVPIVFEALEAAAADGTQNSIAAMAKHLHTARNTADDSRGRQRQGTRHQERVPRPEGVAPCYTDLVPTNKPRHMITETPPVKLGARAKAAELRRQRPSTARARAWLAQRIRDGDTSARSGNDHETLMRRLQALPAVVIDAGIERLALSAQKTLAKIRHHRVSPSDLIISACAHQARAGVLHYDRDYDLIAERTELKFTSEWLAPPGIL